MTVNTTLNRNEYVSIGGDTYSYGPYKVLIKANMVVYVDGVATDPADWSITDLGDENGGDVIFTIAPNVDSTVVLSREVEITQETDYTPYGAFPEADHEDALDKGAMIDQQLQEQLDRAVLAAIDGDSTEDLTFPPYLAGSGIGWDLALKKLVNFGNLYVKLTGDVMSGPLSTPELTTDELIVALVSAVALTGDTLVLSGHAAFDGAGVTAAFADRVNIGGDLYQTGDLFMQGSSQISIPAAVPTQNNHATRKSYVDAETIARIAADGFKFDKAGGKIDGPLEIEPLTDLVPLKIEGGPGGAANLIEIRSASGPIVFGVTTLGIPWAAGDPVAASNLTRKDYVDGLVEGGLVRAYHANVAIDYVSDGQEIPFKTISNDSLGEWDIVANDFTASRDGIYSFDAYFRADVELSATWNVRIKYRNAISGSWQYKDNGIIINNVNNPGPYRISGTLNMNTGDIALLEANRISGGGDLAIPVGSGEYVEVIYIGSLPAGL